MSILRSCLAIVFSAQNLRHYLLNQKTYIISKMDPLKYMMNKIMLNVQVVKWITFLSEFYLDFINHKSIKGQVIVDQFVEAP